MKNNNNTIVLRLHTMGSLRTLLAPWLSLNVSGDTLYAIDFVGEPEGLLYIKSNLNGIKL